MSSVKKSKSSMCELGNIYAVVIEDFKRKARSLKIKSIFHKTDGP